jgi:four helix bundle protein
MKAAKFEELEIWQIARELSKDVYIITSIGPFNCDFRFRDQIRAAAGSIMDNIAEGFDRGGNKEFIQFLSIAKGSAAELRSQLYRALDQNYIDEIKYKEIDDKADKLARKTANLISYLKESSFRGPKFE